MSCRRFEWALVRNINDEAAAHKFLARPQSWKAMDAPFDQILEDRAAGLQEPPPPEGIEEYDNEKGDFDLCLADGGFLQCRVEKQLPGELWCCLLRDIDPALPPQLNASPFERFKRVMVREVPPALLVTCSLTRNGAQYYDAVLTTMSGQVIAEDSVESLEPPKLKELAHHLTLEVAQQGRLQSQNQEVCTMLEGKQEPLSVVVVPEFAWTMLEEWERRCRLGEEAVDAALSPEFVQRLRQALQ